MTYYAFLGPHTERDGMREGAGSVAEVVSLFYFFFLL